MVTPLHKKETIPLKVLEVIPISHNVKKIRIALPSSGDSLHLPVGFHVIVEEVVNGEKIHRPYTPVTTNSVKGYFDLVIKGYSGGLMSTCLHAKKMGDEVHVRGPVGHFRYKPRTHHQLLLLAGGTGITPMLQIMKNINENVEDNTQAQLLYWNRNEDDILLKEELEHLCHNDNRLHATFFLTQPQQKDTLLPEIQVGRLKVEHLSPHIMHCPPEDRKDGDLLVLICGPEGFTTNAVESLHHYRLHRGKHYKKL